MHPAPLFVIHSQRSDTQKTLYSSSIHEWAHRHSEIALPSNSRLPEYCAFSEAVPVPTTCSGLTASGPGRLRVAAVVQCSCEGETTDVTVQGRLQMDTLVAPVPVLNPLPVMVRLVPPPMDPEQGHNAKIKS